MAKPVIEFKNVSKEYRAYKSNRQLASHQLLGVNKGIPRTVLEDLSFSVERGEKVALIGNTGIERDVVIEMIAGISFPDKGKVKVRGSVASAITFTAGFDVEMSLRDNIYIKGYMLGWSRKQIQQREEGILEFAGLTAKKEYKIRDLEQGEAARVGLAMFCEEEADIYLLDSPLMVGDNVHKAICLERLAEIAAKEDKTMVIANKNIAYGNTLCQRGIVFSEGRAVFDGTVKDGMKYFNDNMRKPEEAKVGKAQVEEANRPAGDSDYEEF